MEQKDKSQVRFLITGGHLTPAKAVIEEFKKRGYFNFVWIGRKKTMRGDKTLSNEYLVVHNDLDIPFEDLLTGKIIRFTDIKTFFEFIRNLIRIPVGFIQSIIIILKYKPKVIISFGGYVAVTVVIAGWFLRVPAVTHEQTVISGLANKLIGKFAKKVLVSWKSSLRYFAKSKVKLVGNPLRKEIFNKTTDIFIVNDKLKTIYITGGNQGAHIINKNMIPIIPKLLEKFNVIHQTGLTSVTRDYEKCERLEKSLFEKKKGVYIVRGSIFGAEIGEVFTKADMIISRSGANISTEILALGKPSIVIPIPWSLGNEQLKNAKMIEKLGLAKVIEEKELNSEVLYESIIEGMKKFSRKKNFKNLSLSKTIKKSKALINLDAASLIIDEILSLL